MRADPLTVARDAVRRLTDAEKASIIGDLLTGGFDMSDALADALLPVEQVYREAQPNIEASLIKWDWAA